MFIAKNMPVFLSFVFMSEFRTRRFPCATHSIDLCMKKETTYRVGPFTTIFGHFYANYINIFHKTEVLTIILRCLTCLNLYWIKSYHINHNLFWQLCFSIFGEKKLKIKVLFELFNNEKFEFTFVSLFMHKSIECAQKNFCVLRICKMTDPWIVESFDIQSHFSMPKAFWKKISF